MQNKGDSFDPKSSKRASVAAAPLAAWVTANVRYSHVMDKIKPLTKEQNRLQRLVNRMTRSFSFECIFLEIWTAPNFNLES